MLGSLLSGLAFAIGHHFFYQSFHHQPAPTTFDEMTLLGTKLSLQQFNTAVGTAFAFWVRASLVFAVGIAYLPAMMWSLSTGRDGKVDISSMNILMSALGNLLALTYFNKWWRRPVLYAIALAAWYVAHSTGFMPNS